MILPSASLMGWLLTVAATTTYAITAIAAARWSPRAAGNALLLAWALHGATLIHALVANSTLFGFGPALSVTTWLVLTAYVVERQIFPKLQARWALSAFGAAAVVLAWWFPGQALTVTASPWLALHLALGIACYGLFAAAVVHAWLMTRAERHIRQAEDPHSGMPLLTLERLTFRFVMAGFALLTATLLAGMLFSDVLYQRAWRWDHKAIFAMLSWLTFAALLLGRWRFGWRGRSATRVLYVGAVLLLLAYAGSRFVLEVLLHQTV
jgi:ABC-type uncharacterized transport system permease subunit